jgi:hypothetical protein
LKLESLASAMFGKATAELSSFEASGLIDMLKSVKAGKVDLETALRGAVA